MRESWRFRLNQLNCSKPVFRKWPRSVGVVTTFYETLFSRFPQAKASEMQAQQGKLLEALSLVIQKLRDPDVLAEALQGLGQQHEVYGIRPNIIRLSGPCCWIPLRSSWGTAGTRRPATPGRWPIRPSAP